MSQQTIVSDTSAVILYPDVIDKVARELAQLVHDELPDWNLSVEVTGAELQASFVSSFGDSASPSTHVKVRGLKMVQRYAARLLLHMTTAAASELEESSKRSITATQILQVLGATHPN